MATRTSPDADEDFAGIYARGWEEYGEQEAEAYALGLLDAFALLAANPHIGRERTEVSPPVRLHSHRAHHIIYVIESGDVLVLRILHGRQDWLHQL